MFRKLALLCLLLSNYKGFAQSEACVSTLSGKVLDASSGQPIQHVSVYIPEQKKGQHTDSLGMFQITELCKGYVTVIFQHLNHEIKKERLYINEPSIHKIVYLSCHIDSLHQLVVKGARLHWEDVGVVHKIQGRDLFQTSGLSLGKALEKVNGVYNLSTGTNINKPMIRGMHSNRVLILNNEIRQEGQQWGNEHAPEIDQFMAKQIEVVKGAQTIRYGSDIIGGLILVNPKPLKEINEVQGEYNLALFSNGRMLANSLLLEGRKSTWKGFSGRLQATYKRSGNGKTPDYFLKNSGMKELNYSAAIGYSHKTMDIELFHSYFNTDIAIFAGSHIGNLTDLYKAFNASEPIDAAVFSYNINLPYQHVVHQLSKLKWSLGINKIGILKLTYGLQANTRKEFDKTLNTKQDDGSYKPALHFNLLTHTYDISFEHKPLQKFEGALGINGFYQRNEYYGSYFIPNYKKMTGGIYLVEKWHHQAFSAEAGLRYDLNSFKIKKWENNQLITPSHQFHSLAASTAFRYQFPYITLHFNMGSAWRAPFVNELYSYGVHHSAASFEIGDRTLRLERSLNTAFTIDFNYKRKIDLECTVFNNYVHDYINLQPVFPATLTIRGAFPTFLYSQANVNFSGIEFSASIKLANKIQWYGKANLTNAINSDTRAYLVGIPPARIDNEIEVDIYKKQLKSLSISLGHQYTFKQNRVSDSADYVAAPSAFSLLKADIQGHWRIFHFPIQFNLGANNIFNTRYRDYLNRNRYFANELGRNIYARITFPFNIRKRTTFKPYDAEIIEINGT